MDKAELEPIVVEETSASFSQIVAEQQPWSNFVNSTGLDVIAKEIEGDNFVVCDLQLHGVEGCAAIRDSILHSQFLAELVALGLVIMLVAFVGGIAVAFIHLVAKAAKPIGSHRIHALFPKRHHSQAKEITG